jgi:type II secretory pathway pseudopilin PulG
MKTYSYCMPFRHTAHDVSGFTLVEFLIASTVLLIIAIPLFGALNEIQKTAARQADMQQIMNNIRMAMQTVTRCIRQSGNDPYQAGFDAISILGPTEVRIRSDMTGSEAPGKPDRGDPDGDILDSLEDIRIRYNNLKSRIEMVSSKGSVQILADNISGFSLRYLDDTGIPTMDDSRVRTVRIQIRGTGGIKTLPVSKQFGIQWIETIRILPKK